MRSLMELNFLREPNNQYKRHARSASNDWLLIFLREFALQEIFDERLEDALRQQVLQLRLELLEYLLNHSIHRVGIRYSGRLFAGLVPKIGRRCKKGNLGEGLAVRRRTRRDTLANFKLGGLRFEHPFRHKRAGRCLRGWFLSRGLQSRRSKERIRRLQILTFSRSVLSRCLRLLDKQRLRGDLNGRGLHEIRILQGDR